MAGSGTFIARLTGPDGFVEEKHFSLGDDALAWLKGDGVANFEGDVEIAELWSPTNKLVWSKTRPKQEDQWLAGRSAARTAGVATEGWPAKHPRNPRKR